MTRLECGTLPAVRVLMLTNLYPPHVYGGYELVCRDVAEWFRRAGADVAVLTSAHRRTDVDDDSGQDRDRYVQRNLTPTSLLSPPPRWWRVPGSDRANRRLLRDALRRQQPDVVSVWNVAGLSLTLLEVVVASGLPVVWMVGDSWPRRTASGDPWFAMTRRAGAARGLLGALTGLPTHLTEIGTIGTWCFCSAALRATCELGWPAPFDRTAVTHTGVHLDDFPLLSRRVRPWNWRLLYVGRLDPLKGVDTLIRTLPSLPNEAMLKVIGPPERQHVARLRALVGSLGLDTRVQLSCAPRSALAAHYCAADVLVFPTEWDEPFGIVPLEAMACGTPVVATGTGGSGEYLVDHDNCVLFRAGHPDALAGAVRRVAADAQLRERLVERGRSTAAAFTTDQLASQLHQIHLEAS